MELEAQTSHVKKSFWKQWWFWVIIAVLCIAGYGMGSGDESVVSSTPTPTEAITPTTPEVTKNTASKIELVAGQQGEYGRELVMNAGTEFEEHLIVYYVPSGDYSVTNLGDHPTQVTVYEGVSTNAESYDEYTNSGDVLMIKPKETGNLNVPEGWFIEIQEPTHIGLTPKS